MRKITRTVVGIILIGIGLFALLTPLSPGSWLILVGLECLGLRIILQGRLLAWAKARPDSRAVRTVCRIMFVWERDPAAKRKWLRLWRRRRAAGERSHGTGERRRGSS